MTRKCLGKKSRNVVQLRFKTDQVTGTGRTGVLTLKLQELEEWVC